MHEQKESCEKINERYEPRVAKGEVQEGMRRDECKKMSDVHEKGELSERKVSFLARDTQIAEILESISRLQSEIANESNNCYPKGDDGYQWRLTEQDYV